PRHRIGCWSQICPHRYAMGGTPTYVRMTGAVFNYTALCIDAFAGRIVGWQCSTTMNSAFVESTVRQAAGLRARQGHPYEGSTIHHADAGSQYNSVRFG